MIPSVATTGGGQRGRARRKGRTSRNPRVLPHSHDACVGAFLQASGGPEFRVGLHRFGNDVLSPLPRLPDNGTLATLPRLRVRLKARAYDWLRHAPVVSEAQALSLAARYRLGRQSDSGRLMLLSTALRRTRSGPVRARLERWLKPYVVGPQASVWRAERVGWNRIADELREPALVKCLVLKAPAANGEKGVLYLSFEVNWLRRLVVVSRRLRVAPRLRRCCTRSGIRAGLEHARSRGLSRLRPGHSAHSAHGLRLDQSRILPAEATRGARGRPPYGSGVGSGQAPLAALPRAPQDAQRLARPAHRAGHGSSNAGRHLGGGEGVQCRITHRARTRRTDAPRHRVSVQ